MHPKCRTALSAARVAAGGKELSDAQAAAIDARMSAAMRRLARQDPAKWTATPVDQRMLMGAQQAAADIAGEAARKVQNAQLQAIRTGETVQRVAGYMKRQKSGMAKALADDMQVTTAYIDGIKRDNTRQLIDLIDAANSGEGAGLGRKALMALFDAENPALTHDLALEVFSRGKANTGNALAKKGADAWLTVIENLRVRFNAAGGDVGKLDYGYLPQAHDAARVRNHGQDRWVQDTLPKLDRTRYLNEDGSRMSDAQVIDILRGAWETIGTDGMNKQAPGQFKGAGARANRGSESREIHFKDGDAYLAYLKDFGTGSMYDAMIGHIGGMSRDVGLVERYGPNPEAQMRLQFDLTARAEGTSLDELPRVFGTRLQSKWAVLNGTSGQAVSASIANIGMTARNIEVFGKLQGAVLSSVTDLGSYFVTSGFNNLPYWQSLTNIVKANSKGGRAFLDAHGGMAESMISDLNRWSGENISHNWSGRLANATMRLSLMNFWTDSLRRAFTLTMMQGLGRMSNLDWPALKEYDRWRMESKGLTEEDWTLMRSAQKTQYRGSELITPEAVYATGDPRAGEVVAKMLGMISDESEVAVLNPDLDTRTITTAGGKQRGTVDGELLRAAMQFKAFPIAMVSRHWRRMLETPQGMEGAPLVANRLAYGSAMMLSLTALGAIAFQTKQLVSGKDPVDMTTAQFWSRAMAQGGGLGFVGDMLLQDTTDSRSPMDTLGRTVLGPSYGSVADLYALTKGNIDQALAGEETHAAAEAVKFGRSHAPLLNLWYAKAAIDHAGMAALQENLSPGYLARIQSKAQKDWNQDFWWQPQEGLPSRAPDLGAVAP